MPLDPLEPPAPRGHQHWSLTTLLAHHPLPWARGSAAPSPSEKPTLLLLGDGRCLRTRRMLEEALAPLAGSALADAFHFAFFDRDYGVAPERLARWHAIVHQQPAPSPLLVFFSPEGRPFLTASTLSGSQGGYGPEAERVLSAILEQLETDRDAVEGQGKAILKAEAEALGALPAQGGWGPIEKAFRAALAQATDRREHGVGTGPKQPFPALLRAQLAIPELRDDAMMTLTALCRRGLQDHAGGGFFNHSLDRSWREPYPERRIDHTALLLMSLAEALRYGPDPLFSQALSRGTAWLCDLIEAHGGRLPVAEHTVLREDPQALFLYHRAELKRSLPERAYAVLETLYGLDKAANAGRLWRLERRDSWRSVVDRLGLESDAAREALETGLDWLKNQRPALDFTALYPTLGNALAARALLRAGAALPDERALTHGQALLEELLQDGVDDVPLAWSLGEVGWLGDPAAPPTTPEARLGTQGALLLGIFEALQEDWHPLLAARGEQLAAALAESLSFEAVDAGDGARQSPLVMALEALMIAAALFQNSTWEEIGRNTLTELSSPARGRPLHYASALTLARQLPEVLVLRGPNARTRAVALRQSAEDRTGFRRWTFSPPAPWLAAQVTEAGDSWDQLRLTAAGPAESVASTEDSKAPRGGARVLAFPGPKAKPPS